MSKLDGIKAGDRVRVTFEGDYIGPLVGHDMARFVVPGAVHELRITYKEVEQPTFQITRIEPAFKVGDRVKAAGVCDASTIVAFLSDGRVVCEYEAGETTGVCARHPSVLTHA